MENAKAVVADLVLVGERRAESENAARIALREAADAFERIRRTRTPVGVPTGVVNTPTSKVSDEPEALQARLDAIRTRGRDPTAFGRLPGRRPGRAPPEGAT